MVKEHTFVVGIVAIVAVFAMVAMMHGQSLGDAWGRGILANQQPLMVAPNDMVLVIPYETPIPRPGDRCTNDIRDPSWSPAQCGLMECVLLPSADPSSSLGCGCSQSGYAACFTNNGYSCFNLQNSNLHCGGCGIACNPYFENDLPVIRNCYNGVCARNSSVTE